MRWTVNRIMGLVPERSLNETPLYIVTNQHPRSGIGTYAHALFKLVRSHWPAVRLVNMHYFVGDFGDESLRLVPRRFPRTAIEVPFVKRELTLRFEEAFKSRPGMIHLCGTNYSLSKLTPRSIATIHDYYFRNPVRLGAGRIAIARELANFSTTLTLPRHIRRCRLVVTISQSSKHSIHRLLGLDSVVINHWVDSERFVPREKVAARKHLALPQDKRLILSVGTAAPNKRLWMQAAIVRRLPREYVLIHVGVGFVPGNERVVNVGPVSDIDYPIYFNACDLFLHTSSREGFGRPVLEAAASGLPIVSPRTDPIPELMGDTVVYPRAPESIHRFAEAILSLNNKEIYVGARDAALKRACSYSATEALKRYIECYKLASEAPGP